MNKTQEDKISRFINDKATADAVYQALLNAFLNPSNTDSVEWLAAERISLNILQRVWRDFEKLSNKTDDAIPERSQIAL